MSTGEVASKSNLLIKIPVPNEAFYAAFSIVPPLINNKTVPSSPSQAHLEVESTQELENGSKLEVKE